MTDCFQPCELQYRTTYQAIQEMNLCRVGYLIVTKSALPSSPEYLAILDKDLAHIQITVTCLDDERTAQYEKASPPSQRIRAIQTLQAAGYDAAIRLSPIIEEYMDFDVLNSLEIEKCVIEFLRVNAWIKKWFQGVDFSKYTVRQGGYPAIKTDGGDQYAGCLFVERHGPVSIIVPIESWHSLHLAALPDQPVCYRAAQERRRGALKAQRVDLLIR